MFVEGENPTLAHSHETPVCLEGATQVWAWIMFKRFLNIHLCPLCKIQIYASSGGWCSIYLGGGVAHSLPRQPAIPDSQTTTIPPSARSIDCRPRRSIAASLAHCLPGPPPAPALIPSRSQLPPCVSYRVLAVASTPGQSGRKS